MEELSKLEHLSLVSKICTELDNHLGMNDKDLAEFIIDLAETHTTFDTFKKALIENGAEFPDSFIKSLLRIIQLMKTSKKLPESSENDFISKPDADRLAIKFPGLAMPNEKQDEIIMTKVEKNEKDEKDEKKFEKKLNSVADDMMAELESFAPSKGDSEIEPKKSEKRERSRERERKSRRERSKEREKDRDRDRDKDRSSRRSRSRDKRPRSRSRDRRRSPSQSKERRRSRSRDRRRRSRSMERRRSTSRERYRDRQRNRNRSRSTSRGRRNRSPPRKRSATPLPDGPEPGKIYSGRVANIVPFGCFVQLTGVKKRVEGLVHISQLRSEGRVTDVTEVVSRGSNVKVKVISIAGQKMSLTMKEVDQQTGADLNPASHSHMNDEMRDRNPDRPGADLNPATHLRNGNTGVEDDLIMYNTLTDNGSKQVVRSSVISLLPGGMSRSTPTAPVSHTNVAFIQKDGEPSRCSLCPASFPKSHQLLLHMYIHYMNPERKFRCELCGKNFKTERRLHNHNQSETHSSKVNIAETHGNPTSKNPEPFECSDCSLEFREKVSWPDISAQIHMRKN
ncbi:ATP-dependent RNA helicase DHX8-like [Sitodiplosis mosellana]|uniref:ATP-dependent RNA helicase DHX8-like n=1 Tax=Sitodiplosis mosellana TaxID=263140 RepID=UPI002444395C|nr:ATP-dependent RNA helicase DHX8-like [Sitodiplosis mosellana]